MVLETGSSVPTIQAKNQEDETVRPDFSTPTVVYFYPRDDTPGCTTEAVQFDERYEQYHEAGVDVYGVSTDDVDSHCEFAQMHDLSFDLLADSDSEIAAAFDVDITDGACSRTTFVIAREQVIGVYEGVRPDGHAAEVLRDLKEAGFIAMADSPS